VAQVKNYGLIGVGGDLQLGKQGPRFLANADTGTVSVTNEGGVATTLSGANAINASDFVTKSQLDSIQTAEATFTSSLTYNGGNSALGTIPAGTKTVITTLTVSQVFDGNASITIGTNSDNNQLMGSIYNELDIQSSYQTITTFNFVADTAITAFVPSSNATQGTATVVVSYY